MNNRAPAFTKQSFSPIPLPSYVKRLSVSSRASSPSSLLAQHSSTVSGDAKHLSVPTVPHRSVPSPAPDQQQQASAYQVQQSRSEHNSSPLFGLSADSPLSFSGIDSGPPGPVDNDVKSEAGMNFHDAMPYSQFTDNHYSPMMPQMQHSPVMQHAHHHHGHHMSASAGQNDFPEALVEKMMLDLRRASTGGGL